MAFLSSGFMFYSKSRSQVQQTDKRNGFAARIWCRLVLPPFFEIQRLHADYVSAASVGNALNDPITLFLSHCRGFGTSGRLKMR